MYYVIVFLIRITTDVQEHLDCLKLSLIKKRVAMDRPRLLARRPSSRPKDGQFSEMGDFGRPFIRTSVLNVTKQCL